MRNGTDDEQQAANRGIEDIYQGGEDGAEEYDEDKNQESNLY